MGNVLFSLQRTISQIIVCSADWNRCAFAMCEGHWIESVLERENCKLVRPWILDTYVSFLPHRSAGHHLHGRDNHDARGDRAGDGENPTSPGSFGPTGVRAQVYVSVWGKQQRKERGLQRKGARAPNIHCWLLCAGKKVLGTIKKKKNLTWFSLLPEK